MTRALLAAASALLLLAGCTASSATTIQPRDGRSGLWGTGTLDGRQVVVTGGLPELLVGDCDPGDGPDRDVCFITSTIDGQSFVLTIQNPDVLVEGAELDVEDPGCGPGDGCDDVAGVAVVTIKLGTEPARRATNGTLRVTTVEPFQRYAGRLNLTLPNGRFTGTFDVVPRPD